MENVFCQSFYFFVMAFREGKEDGKQTLLQVIKSLLLRLRVARCEGVRGKKCAKGVRLQHNEAERHAFEWKSVFIFQLKSIFLLLRHHLL